MPGPPDLAAAPKAVAAAFASPLERAHRRPLPRKAWLTCGNNRRGAHRGTTEGPGRLDIATGAKPRTQPLISILPALTCVHSPLPGGSSCTYGRSREYCHIPPPPARQPARRRRASHRRRAFSRSARPPRPIPGRRPRPWPAWATRSPAASTPAASTSTARRGRSAPAAIPGSTATTCGSARRTARSTGSNYNEARVRRQGRRHARPGAPRPSARNPQYVTILIGANDACTSSEASMTAVGTFRGAHRHRAGHAQERPAQRQGRRRSASPTSSGSGRSAGPARSARTAWSLFGICKSMLANPTSTAAADTARRDRVRQRVVDFNAQLARPAPPTGRTATSTATPSSTTRSASTRSPAGTTSTPTPPARPRSPR